MATRQRTRNSHDSVPPSVAQSFLNAEPPPPADVKFHGERVPLREREARIAETAYLRAARRDFAPGMEIDDWLEAEREIDALLSAREPRS